MDIDVRLEDYAKNIIQQIPVLEKDTILENLQAFFVSNMGSKYYLLLSKEVDYYTIFKIKSQSPAVNLYEYFMDSSFIKNGELIPMTNIQHFEPRDDKSIEVWIGNTYFHLTPFDWGVEDL